MLREVHKRRHRITRREGSMRGQRAPPQQARPSRSGEGRRYMVPSNEIEVVVSPTGRQRLQAQAAEQQGKRMQPSEYNASKYKVYERPQPAYPTEQV